ncbi:MAG: PBSX family phage terminase large subunit [Synergistes sp.]|nr:PBSX family phage terminase large subunit [Synergistes sp.]
MDCDKFDTLICDGAIRSGKTSVMAGAFISWAMREFNGNLFGLCGKTVESCVKNIVTPLISQTWFMESFPGSEYRRTDKLLIVKKGDVVNYFEVFGGNDERSYQLIQGRTLAGIFLDEVALMPQSFVNQATARCSVTGSRFWFSCNPAGQAHWFNQDWILAEREKTLHLHFELDDNPSLTEEIIERYKSIYTGLFYDRYIRGLWVSAEGVIYDMFDADEHLRTVDESEILGDYYVACDYGASNATVFLLFARTAKSWHCLREYYYSGRDNQHTKTNSELARDLTDWLRGIEPSRVIIDPSAESFTRELQKSGFYTTKAKNDVANGISDVSSMLTGRRLTFDPSCTHIIDEFGSYVWDAKASEKGIDKPVKTDDHCVTGDTLVNTTDGKVAIKDLVGKTGELYSFDGEHECVRRFSDVRKTREQADIFCVTLADGQRVKCTGDHLFLTTNGWKEAQKLTKDDEIISLQRR